MGTPPDPVAALREQLDVETRRVSDRLRVLGEARIGPHLPLLRSAAQTLIDSAVAAESAPGAADPGRPERGRTLPEVELRAWPDVIKVLSTDVWRAGQAADGPAVASALKTAVEVLVQLRRAL